MWGRGDEYISVLTHVHTGGAGSSIPPCTGHGLLGSLGAAARGAEGGGGGAKEVGRIPLRGNPGDTGIS